MNNENEYTGDEDYKKTLIEEFNKLPPKTEKVKSENLISFENIFVQNSTSILTPENLKGKAIDLYIPGGVSYSIKNPTQLIKHRDTWVKRIVILEIRPKSMLITSPSVTYWYYNGENIMIGTIIDSDVVPGTDYYTNNMRVKILTTIPIDAVSSINNQIDGGSSGKKRPYPSRNRRHRKSKLRKSRSKKNLCKSTRRRRYR